MSISNQMLSEQDIRNFIYNNLPGISYDEMWEIRNQFIYDFIPLEVAVERAWRKRLIKSFEQSKEKCYWDVPMLNGGRKIVYMCKDQVELMYEGKDYRKVG